MKYLWIVIIIGVLIVAIGIVAVILGKKSRKEDEKTGKHPKGYYTNIGVAIGIPAGMAIGIALDLIGVGVAIGAAIGISIGVAMEKKHEGELRELTEEELKTKKVGLWVACGLLLLGVAAGIVFYLLAS